MDESLINKFLEHQRHIQGCADKPKFTWNNTSVNKSLKTRSSLIIFNLHLSLTWFQAVELF